MRLLQSIHSGYLCFVWCSGKGVILPAGGSSCLEFWGLFRGYRNARVLRGCCSPCCFPFLLWFVKWAWPKSRGEGPLCLPVALVSPTFTPSIVFTICNTPVFQLPQTAAEQAKLAPVPLGISTWLHCLRSLHVLYYCASFTKSACLAVSCRLWWNRTAWHRYLLWERQ